MRSLMQLARTAVTVSFDQCIALTEKDLASFMNSCPNVKHLSFSKTRDGRMEGWVLYSIATHCTTLQSINLSYSMNIGYANLVTLAKRCKNLVEMNLSHGHQWSFCIPTLAANCPQLQCLRADGCTMCEDDCLVTLSQYCHHLQHLSIREWRRVTNTGIHALTACAELRSFTVTGNDFISSTSIVELAKGCVKLQDVCIPKCVAQIHLAIEALVQHCPTLRILRSDSSHVSNTCLSVLHPCITLRTVELCYNTHITAPALVKLLQHCSHLQYLLLPDCWHVRPPEDEVSCASTTASTSTGLQCLDFIGSSTLPEDTLITLIAQNTSLQELYLMHCCKLTDAAVLAVAAHCPLLRRFDCTCFRTDHALVTLVEDCPRLEWLNVSHCPALTDASAVALAQYCPKLQYLDMSNCNAITDAGIVEVVRNCRLLRELHLRWCTSLTGAVLDACLQHGTRMRLIDLLNCKNVLKSAVTRLQQVRPNCVVRL